MRYWSGLVLAKFFAFFWGTGKRWRSIKTQKIIVVYYTAKMKFSLQEQNKKSRVGKNTTKWFNEHSNGKKDHIFQLRLIWFSTLFTGIEVFIQIVHFFFIDMCCKSHCSKLLLRKAKCFSVLGGSPRVPTHYPFIYRTIFWQKRYPFINLLLKNSAPLSYLLTISLPLMK